MRTDPATRLRDALPAGVVSSRAQAQMLDALLERLRFASTPVLTAERRAARALGLPPPQDTTVERYPAYPQLRAQLEDDWLAAMVELAHRFQADHPDDGPIQAISPDRGDRHSHGRAVAILHLSDRVLVYKPRDLRVVAAFWSLVADMNDAGLSPALPIHTLQAHPHYAWEPLVSAAPCTDHHQAERYFVRFGMWLRLMQVLEARDLWLDNLIAAGEYPIFIDLETILQHRRPRQTSTEAERTAWQWLEASVIPTAMLAHPMRLRPGEPAEDIGALTREREMRLPFREPDGRARTYRRPEAIPRLDERPLRAADFLDELETGYHRMTRHLRAHPPSLDRFAGLPVRHLHRGTIWALHQAQRSLSTQSLSSTARREESLRTIPPRDPRLLPAEIAAIARLDVPLFVANVDEDSVYTDTGEQIIDVFDGAPLARARHRLQNISPDPRHAEAIRATLATGDGVRWRLEPLPPTSLAQAIAVGDEILAAAFRGSDGSLAWIGWRYAPPYALVWPGVLAADLWTGTAGLAIVFARLFQASKLNRFRHAALQALSTKAPQTRTDPLRGVDAYRFALTEIGTILQRPELRERADAMALPPRPALSIVEGDPLWAAQTETRPMRLRGDIPVARRWNLSAMWGLGAEVLAGLPEPVIPWAQPRY